MFRSVSIYKRNIFQNSNKAGKLEKYLSISKEKKLNNISTEKKYNEKYTIKQCKYKL